MPKMRRKVIRAGSLWMAVQYTAIHGQNQTARREMKSQISTPAREALNARTSWQKLMLLLACNFRKDDLVVTLTYRDADLPKVREQADRNLSNFIRNLRKQRRLRDPDPGTVYVRVTEGYHSLGRLHHHLILNATGDDFLLIRKLWAKYGDDIDFEQFGWDGAERWAKYLTKEPREKGRRYVGDRTWRASRNMIRPSATYEFVSENEVLSPPAGAWVLEKTECENCYGRFCHLMAQLPENEKLNLPSSPLG